MDPLSTLASLGLTLPSPAYLIGATVFGLVGLVAYYRGKRLGRPRTRWLGLALMLYPYLVPQTWLLYVVGAVLCGAIAFDRA